MITIILTRCIPSFRTRSPSRRLSDIHPPPA
nr:MAG TPA: hypothetical protein [Microviridae sp.]